MLTIAVSRPQLRFNSTSSPPNSPSTSGKPSTSSSQSDFFERHPRRSGPPSRHSLFYREIYPPFLRCIAYGSGAYFALHLLWTYLDGEEQKVVEEQQRAEMEDKIKELRQKAQGALAGVTEGAENGKKEGGSWWKVWSR